MAYFVTGATGFIGSNLVERLLKRTATKQGTDADIYVLVRQGSLERLDSLIRRWSAYSPKARARVKPVTGDLHEPLLGIDGPMVKQLGQAGVKHFFHLAAIYDMSAADEVNELTNVEGTRHAIELAAAINAHCLHHVSSIAVAGFYKGLFTEQMFDEGQALEHPYHRTKFASEQLVREESALPWRIYRPSVVVGDSHTGQIDKIDGPYYFFPLLKRARHYVPEWLPLIGPEIGHTNIVPVDFVADALDHIAHQPNLARTTFHLTDPQSRRASDVLNIFAKVAKAPHFSLTVNAGSLGALSKSAAAALMSLPGAKQARRALLSEAGIPEEVVDYIDLTARFATTNADAALAGSGIEVPPLENYAALLWNYWEHNLDPELARLPTTRGAVAGKIVLITGASSGIGRATAIRIAAAGGIPLLVARGVDKLEDTKREIELAGGSAYSYAADISDLDAVAELVDTVLAEHEAIDVLINNAGRSIRRSIALSYDRFHDFERTIQLNYLGTIRLTMGLLPSMRERHSGHVINISSIGVQTNPPRFSAYVASKSALDAWTRVVSSECIADNVHFTTVHMPLVKTPMIAPTKMYDRFPTITPDEAADIIIDAIRTRPKVVSTKLGTFGEVSYALAPKLIDQVLGAAYKIFPDSAAARGQVEPGEHASREQALFARLLRGTHW
jgi:thioester reductase-like protein/NAD(P)-dependent dehydrogenase (short-subunit alcohol dehydrogenase family)